VRETLLNVAASAAEIDPSPILQPVIGTRVVAPESMTGRTLSVYVHLVSENIEPVELPHVAAALWAGISWFKPYSYAAAFSPFQWRFHKVLLHSAPASLWPAQKRLRKSQASSVLKETVEPYL